MNENQKRWESKRKEKGFQEQHEEGVDKFAYYGDTPFSYLHQAKESDDFSKTGLRTGARNPETVAVNERRKRDILKRNEENNSSRRNSRRRRTKTAEAVMWRDGGDNVAFNGATEENAKNKQAATRSTTSTRTTRKPTSTKILPTSERRQKQQQTQSEYLLECTRNIMQGL